MSDVLEKKSTSEKNTNKNNNSCFVNYAIFLIKYK